MWWKLVDIPLPEHDAEWFAIISIISLMRPAQRSDLTRESTSWDPRQRAGLDP